MTCGARRRDRARQARFVAWQAVACKAASVRSGESRFFLWGIERLYVRKYSILLVFGIFAES